jgi:branched-chain amino acid transport system ATP-binding protein
MSMPLRGSKRIDAAVASTEVQGLRRVFDRPHWDDGPRSTVLSCEDVEVAFGGVVALSKLTFEVIERDIVAVVGPNGAGKTTMLNAVCGMLSKAKGTIHLMGEPVLGRPPERLVAAGIGRSFQNPPLLDTESVLDNVLLGDHVRLGYTMADQIFRRGRVKKREDDARERARGLLGFLGLSAVQDKRAGSLPYGTRKLIDIARALASGPHLLLLDEPTSGLDMEERGAVARALVEIHRAAPVSILIVEHHMDIVRSIAHKVVALQSGKVAVQGSVDDVMNSAAFQESMLGQTKPVPLDPKAGVP